MHCRRNLSETDIELLKIFIGPDFCVSLNVCWIDCVKLNVLENVC